MIWDGMYLLTGDVKVFLYVLLLYLQTGFTDLNNNDV